MPIKMPSPDEVGLTPLQPARPEVAYVGGIGAEGGVQMGQDIQQAGAPIMQAGAQFRAASDAVAEATAQSTFLQTKLGLDQKFAADTAYDTKATRYAGEIQDAANTAAQGIPSPITRTQFINTTQRWQEYGIAQMRQQAHQMSVEAAQGQAHEQFNTTLHDLGQAPDDGTRAALVDTFTNKIDSLRSAGSVTPAQAAEFKYSLNQQAALNKLNTILNTNPSLGMRLFRPDAPPFPAGVSSDVAAGIYQAASKYGVPEDFLARTAQIESSGGTNRGPSSAGASGPFGLMPAVAAGYGVNPQDPMGSADATAQIYQRNHTALVQGLGREPTAADMYLAHQQGGTGAIALLTHPDEPAVDVLSAIFHNRSTAESAITGNGGSASMSAGQFAQMWQQKWGDVSGAPQPGTPQGKHATVPSSRTDELGAALYTPRGDWRDFVPSGEMAKAYQTATIYARDAQTAQTTDQERQVVLEQHLIKIGSDQAESNIIADTMGIGDNPKITASQIADPIGPYAKLTSEAKMRMIDFFKRNVDGTDNHDTGTYGQGFYDLYRRVNAPQGDPNRLTNPAEVYNATGPGLALTLAGSKQLLSDMKDRGSPEGEADQTMLHQFIANARGQITGTSDGLHIKDPKGDELFLRFLAKTLPAYTAARREGQSAAGLLDPGSKDYLGASIGSFKRPMNQWTQDMVAANRPEAASNAPPDLNTRDGIIAAYHAGTLTRDGASQALIGKGFAVGATPPPAAIPAVPEVPLF